MRNRNLTLLISLQVKNKLNVSYIGYDAYFEIYRSSFWLPSPSPQSAQRDRASTTRTESISTSTTEILPRMNQADKTTTYSTSTLRLTTEVSLVQYLLFYKHVLSVYYSYPFSQGSDSILECLERVGRVLQIMRKCNSNKDKGLSGLLFRLPPSSSRELRWSLRGNHHLQHWEVSRYVGKHPVTHEPV